jgi:hypothetical protein
MRIVTLVSLFLMAIALSANVVMGGDKPANLPEKAALRVGIFDSRAVAVAYARSPTFGEEIKQLKEEHARAKAAGNQSETKRLEAEGRGQQDRLHQQGFSTASIANILEKVKDKLPAIAKEAKVDLIVSKWDMAYLAPGAETVDVTGLMVKMFNPNQKTLEIVGQLGKQKPIPLGELKIGAGE